MRPGPGMKLDRSRAITQARHQSAGSRRRSATDRRGDAGAVEAQPDESGRRSCPEAPVADARDETAEGRLGEDVLHDPGPAGRSPGR
eukprot:14277449-Alexandrium_andersonii.AAC.1